MTPMPATPARRRLCTLGGMKKLLAALPPLLLAAAARADVQCQFADITLNTGHTQSQLQHSASGQRGRSGKLSFFAVRAGNDDNPSSSIDLKAVDVTAPGDYDIAHEPGWASVIRVHGKMQRITSGRITFTQFAVSGPRAHATGTASFKTAQTEGRCSFDVDVQAVDRDTLPH